MNVTREMLAAYLDDALDEAESAGVERALRDSDALRGQLRQLMAERDRGEHSVGAIWRRQRLTCPSRDQLGSYLLGALDTAVEDYVEFHLRTIACAFCQANLADLKAQQAEPPPLIQKRRRRYYESSAGLLR